MVVLQVGSLARVYTFSFRVRNTSAEGLKSFVSYDTLNAATDHNRYIIAQTKKWSHLVSVLETRKQVGGSISLKVLLSL